MKRLIITEDEKKHIKQLYNINEIDKEAVKQSVINYMKDVISGKVKPETSKDDTSGSESEYETTKTSAGEYFINPNYEDIKINYGGKAVPLNKDAETLLKSIFAEAGTPNLRVTSTLRTYEDQARVNLQNSRSNILNWYGSEVAKVWDKYKAGQMTQQEYADFLRNRDKSRGKLLSNHLSGFAIDVVPYSDKFATTAEKLMKKGNSGIKKVLREKSNNTVHIEFDFTVTDKGGIIPPSGSPTNRSERKSDKAIYKSGIIVDKKNNTNKYAIVFGGSPSNKYGAQYMYNIGTNILNDKNVVYSNFENSLDSVINYLKSIVPNVEITSVSGFSAGGKNAWEAASKGYKVGLIDPVVTNDAFNLLGRDLSGDLPSNIKMISKQENWSGPYRKHGNYLSKIESGNQNIRRNVSHLQMPTQFFTEFETFV